MKKISLMIVMVALSLVGWKTKELQGASMETSTKVSEYIIENNLDGEKEKLKEVTLKLKPGAGDVARLELLTVTDNEGNVFLEKVVPNNTAATLKFKVTEDLNELQVKYGKINRKLKLVNNVAKFNFKKYASR